ncbi:hypothetical protein SERLA73DRAFT_138752 [Serpula lacrymans var. lacrymans S7.3]|uniref:C2H2-type domain-containing protein n=3 Tax=Serpula lacrymans var. lacrymans TaxID=341189 RepID=F8PZP1_SERL3|nr:hypothetical protein SERLA73DRAFT_138752 [Serpula lacrymans var. lacrymans S7.3]
MDSCKRRHSGRSNSLSYQRQGTSPSSSSSSRKRPASGVSTSERLAKRPRFSPAPRNVQASLENIASSATERPTKSNPWACPHCSWVQRNHRTPDLKRHIRTHTRFQQPALWVCCGVALELSGPYVIPEDAQPYDFQGRMMIGGCGKEFSRRDALKRHLDNHNITCIGDLNNFATSYD